MGSKHLAWQGKAVPHHTAGSLSGGKCLAKHLPNYEVSKSCSHRWQAFEKAVTREAMYTLTDEQVRGLGEGRWSLLFRGGRKVVNRLLTAGQSAALSADNKGMYVHEVDKPAKGDWDVDRGNRNFKWDCNTPYYHEAHHVIPDATLRTALLEVFDAELALLVVSEMLNAPYSVHHQDNMLILPMDQRVGELLQLPIHRETKQCSHTVYDTYVRRLLIRALRGALEQIMKKHDEEGGEPRFKDLAREVERLARNTYEEVAAARRAHGVSSIEEYGAKLLSSPQHPS